MLTRLETVDAGIDVNHAEQKTTRDSFSGIPTSQRFSCSKEIMNGRAKKKKQRWPKVKRIDRSATGALACESAAFFAFDWGSC